MDTATDPATVAYSVCCNTCHSACLGFMDLAEALLSYGRKILQKEAKKLPVSSSISSHVIPITMRSRGRVI